MKAFVFSGLVFSIVGLTTSSPLAQGDDQFSDDKWLGLDLKRVNNPDYCSPEQAAVIKETMRKVADEFIPHAISNFDKYGVHDGAFHQIWMGRGETKHHWESDDRKKWDLNIIKHNLERARTWPITGTYTESTNEDGETVRKIKKNKQVVLHCFAPTSTGEIRNEDDLCARDPNAGAFYKEVTSQKNIIVFCPSFFTDKIPFLNGRTEKKADGGSVTMNLNVVRQTKEHMLLHEYMHADEMEFFSVEPYYASGHISDKHLEEGKSPVIAYGAINCNKFSRENKRNNAINVDALFNADHYAMYATLAWFQSRWNWEWDDKSLRYSYKNWHVTEGLVENPKDVYDAPEDDYEIPVETIAASATSKPTPSQTNFNPAVPTHDELKIRGSQLDHNELRHFVA